MAALRKPIPTPKFYPRSDSFSTKKENGTPHTCAPPPLPYKSAPPAMSRVFKRPLVQRAQAVSFRDSDCSISSRHYNESSRMLYFDQCFKIESKLGSGSFSDVFKVRSIEDGKTYAVKRFRERFRGETDRKRKLEEVQKLEQLPNHPNCIKFIKAWEECQHLYIQTELCETNLNDYCEKNHDVGERLVWKYTVDLLQAINHLHTHDLIHLDIKPENIFISMDDICKLGDFGLVHDMKKGDSSEAQEGDPKYLAPELMNGRFTKAADIFSLGMTILELATDLNLPKGGDSWHHLRSGYLPFDFTRDLSPDLKNLIQQMLNPNYRERITSEQCLELPAIKKGIKRRRRELYCKSVLRNLKSRFLAIFMYFASCFVFLGQHIFHIFCKSPPIKTPPTSFSSYPRHPSEWDLSFSEDELFDESIVSASNSMGGNSIFDSSSSSDGRNGNTIFDRPQRRFTNSTPAARRDRSNFLNDSYQFTPKPSPLSLDKSPIAMNGSLVNHNSSVNSSSPYDYDHDQVPYVRPKSFIGPKNLMKVFESSLDDED